MKKLIIISALAITATITGCATKSSPEAHARHFVSTNLESHDANMKRPYYANYMAYKQRFEFMYQLGKEAKKSGTAKSEAHDVAITAADKLISEDNVSNFMGIKGADYPDYYSPNEKNALLKGYMETFFDGYNGN